MSTINTKTLFAYFKAEMERNAEDYVDSISNTFVPTWLADAYIDENKDIKPEDEGAVHEAVIDWFKIWEGRKQYNNE